MKVCSKLVPYEADGIAFQLPQGAAGMIVSNTPFLEPSSGRMVLAISWMQPDAEELAQMAAQLNGGRRPAATKPKPA